MLHVQCFYINVCVIIFSALLLRQPHIRAEHLFSIHLFMCFSTLFAPKNHKYFKFRTNTVVISRIIAEQKEIDILQNR